MLLALFVLSTSLVGTVDRQTGYTVLSWTENDGLPSSSVWALAQDQHGYLWLGTNDGVVRFDGNRFTPWNTLSPDRLPERRVMTLLSASDGSVWVGFGGSGGISRLRDLEARNYDQTDGIPQDFVIALVEDSERAIWAATASGLYRLRSDRWEKVGAEAGVPDGRISSIYQDKSANLWIGTNAGIFRRASGAAIFYRVDAGGSLANAISQDAQGSIWTTHPLRGFRRVPQVGAPAPAAQDYAGNGLRLLHDRRGDFWIGTMGQGLWRVRNGGGDGPHVQAMTISHGLASNVVRSVIEDTDGNIWVGADQGLSRLSVSTITALRDLGLVRAVVAARDGTVWAATAGGLIRDPGTPRERLEMSTWNVSALHEDASGTLWAATDHGVYKRVAGRLVRVPLPPTIRPERIVALTSTSRGDLWLSDNVAGVFRLRHGELTQAPFSPEVGRRSAYDLFADRRDRVWGAMSGGLLAVFERDETIQLYGPRAGGSFRSLHVGRDNSVWVAGDDGLGRLHPSGTFVMATRDNGLPGNTVSAVIEDPEGFVWAGVSTGIIRLNAMEFDQLAEDPAHQIRYSLFDRSDGLAGLPLRLGSPGAAQGADGRVWFVTGGGLAMTDAAKVQSSSLRPRARIETVVVDDTRVFPRPGASLPPLTQRMEIEFAAPNVLASGKIRFRYRLDGYDGDWIDAGSRRQAAYTSLSPGPYRFRVMASTTEGIWTDSGASWDFEVQPAFYQTAWFPRLGVLAIVLAVAIAVWAAWRLRVRRIRRQFSLILAERTRVGRELHDTLLQSLVGVSLQLEALSNRVDAPPDALKQQLRCLRRRVEEYLREARESIWELRSPAAHRADFVSSLRDAGEQATAGSPVRFDFALAGRARELSVALEEQLLRIAREAIQNSMRHAKAGRLQLRLAYETDCVRLLVTDDGLGFDLHPAGELEHHFGLKSMQERAELVGGRLTVRSSRDHGTEVETIVPLAAGSYRYAS